MAGEINMPEKECIKFSDGIAKAIRESGVNGMGRVAVLAKWQYESLSDDFGL